MIRPPGTRSALTVAALCLAAASWALSPSPAEAQTDDEAPTPLTVAVVLDLRLPPSHLPDGGAAVDEALLDRLLGLAEVLIERRDVPLSVVVSPETLDALALVGDDASLAVLQAALRDRQLLAATWTSLNLHNWSRTARADVVLDGLRRSTEALRWAGLEAGTVMYVDFPLTVQAVRAVTGAGGRSERVRERRSRAGRRSLPTDRVPARDVDGRLVGRQPPAGPGRSDPLRNAATPRSTPRSGCNRCWPNCSAGPLPALQRQ